VISQRAHETFAEEGPSRAQWVGLAAVGALRGPAEFLRDNPHAWQKPGQEAVGGIPFDYDWRPVRTTDFAVGPDKSADDEEEEDEDDTEDEPNWNLGLPHALGGQRTREAGAIPFPMGPAQRRRPHGQSTWAAMEARRSSAIPARLAGEDVAGI
jgi:hypothetical protein